MKTICAFDFSTFSVKKFRFIDSEADLKGHIEVQIQKEIEDAKESQIKDDNIKLYDQDYQLARAIDLLRGVNVYKKIK